MSRSDRSEPRTVLGRLQDMVAHSTASDLELMSRFASLLREASRRPLGGWNGGRGLVERGTELMLDWCALVTRHRRAFLDDTLAALERSLETGSPGRASGQRRTSGPPTETDSGGIPELTVAAGPGESAAARFLVENPHPSEVTLSFRAEAVTGHPELPSDWVTFHPHPLRIEAGSRALAQVRVAVPEEVESSRRERGAILRTWIRGLEGRRLLLTLHLPAAVAEESRGASR